MSAHPPAAPLLASGSPLVVKVGSALLIEGGLDPDGLAADIAGRGAPTILVSSGAVALGRQAVSLDANGLPERQALSAIGQTRLMALWERAFAGQGLRCAQVLLTPDVTDGRSRYLNARAALRTLMAAGVVPVVNENDAVATDELRYGDNDGLAARVAGLVGAGGLVLLSDVDGVYDRPPDAPGAAPIPHVPPGGRLAVDDGGTRSRHGTGGIRSKIKAARLAASWGVPALIASGRHPRPLTALAEGARATLFEASEATSARRRWLAGATSRTGAVTIDEGAAAALRAGASLLAVGVTGTPRPFRQGEVIEARSADRLVAFGLASCDAAALAGGEARLVMHRDDMVVTDDD